MTMLVLAHAGHWLVNLLYVLPVAIVVVALGWQSFKDRRAGGRSATPSTNEGDGDA